MARKFSNELRKILNIMMRGDQRTLIEYLTEKVKLEYRLDYYIRTKNVEEATKIQKELNKLEDELFEKGE